MDYCANDPVLSQSIIWGYQDALPISKAASDALTKLQVFLGSGGKTRTEALEWNAAIVQTFESIFGKIIPDLSSETLATLETNYRIQQVLNVAENMESALGTAFAPNLEIHCNDDDFLELTGVDEYYDSRPVDKGGAAFVSLAGDCSTEIPMAYTWSPAPQTLYYLDVTVYCGYKSDDWNEHRIADLKDSAFDSTFHIDQIADKYIALTVVHETTHS